jgi:trigger factor
MLSISEKKLENATIELQIDVPVDKVESEYQTVFNKLKNFVKIDGFRKGKAPLHLVENRFKNEADHEVAENLLKNVFLEAIEEKKLVPIALPRYEFDTISREQPFTFKAIFEVSPTVELGKYTGISADEPACVITDENVTAEIDSVRERFAKIDKKSDEAIIRNGDLVKLKVKRVDDVEQDKLDTVEFKEYSIMVGKSKDESALDKHIVGMKAQEEKKIDVKYPKDYYLPELAGQKATYHVIIAEISNVELPDVDDEFAKKLGHGSRQEFIDKTREYLEKFVIEHSRGEAKGQILKEIVEGSKFDIPETMILNEMDNLFLQTQERIGYRSNSIEEFASIMGQNAEEFKNNLRERATRIVKTSLSLMEIAKKEGLKIDENRYKDAVENLAKKNNTTAEQVEKIIDENNSRQNIESKMLLDSALDFIYDNAKIKKLKPVSLDEFLKLTNS